MAAPGPHINQLPDDLLLRILVDALSDAEPARWGIECAAAALPNLRCARKLRSLPVRSTMPPILIPADAWSRGRGEMQRSSAAAGPRCAALRLPSRA